MLPIRTNRPRSDYKYDLFMLLTAAMELSYLSRTFRTAYKLIVMFKTCQFRYTVPTNDLIIDHLIY